MANYKKNKQNARSTVTIQLSASSADFVVVLLSKELEIARKKQQASQAANILKLLKSFQHAIEFEERQRSQRKKTDTTLQSGSPASHQRDII